MIKAEYIWMDGSQPTKRLRSKTKVLPAGTVDMPEWSFDGSSTNQAAGHASDCLLKPVFVCDDPLRGGEHKLVLCEVMTADGTPHASNTRALLRDVAARFADEDPWFGIEQEYTMFSGGRPLGWPEHGYPAPQGPFYCGVGADEVFGREIAEEHLQACMDAGLKIYGINAEVMPGQWEFQIGTAGPMEVSDHLIVARWLLFRIGEEYGVSMTLDPKPVRGDWNGAGAHTNVSTRSTRAEGGMAVIDAAMGKLEARHRLHIENYGAGIEQRLTGLHETCDYRRFAYGIGDRGAIQGAPRIAVDITEAGKKGVEQWNVFVGNYAHVRAPGVAAV